MYSIAITYAVTSLLLLFCFAYNTFNIKEKYRNHTSKLLYFLESHSLSFQIGKINPEAKFQKHYSLKSN